ncbi:MAG: hypothetical protein JW751_01625 [Polyangiaceae bacterium]|nr:hypothetical protein [Polyangiaceae bacterium]
MDLAEALATAIPAYGGKASHYAAFPHMPTRPFMYPEAFVVPVYYYRQFMEENGFFDRIAALQDDPRFTADPAVRQQRLEELQADMMEAPVDEELESAVVGMLEAIFQTKRVKFRSSTNCEDLDGFTGAGLYESAGAAIGDPDRPVLDAMRKVWASTWRFRAYEERDYRSISHNEVGMALLVNRAFPDELANGVAITANPFDTRGVEPGFYVNVQLGDESVVLPDPGITTDQFVAHYDMPGQPIVYLGHSNLVFDDETVLTRSQVNELGEALTAVHAFFNPVYGPNTPEHFYAMDVEFKFDEEPDGSVALYIKQARPYPGRGQ